ncbi:hypothetical protein HLB35_14690 [Halomonas sp. TBZ9]|uniref:Uncharacterized protein n=1 Tax=Vreelandella azerica TaxID=2732867 RepID=A0A7Y3U073_9GAMM|nr:hypothetical protein [Halomonas azerica]NOG32692.1 hypothetical protein [Halomonas azerica]
MKSYVVSPLRDTGKNDISAKKSRWLMSLSWHSSERKISQATEASDIQQWLDLQADRLVSAHTHLHLIEGIALWEQEGQYLPIALWPSQADGVGLLDVANQSLEAAQGVAVAIGNDIGVGYPIVDRSPGSEGHVLGAVAFYIAYRSTQASNQRYLTTFLYHLEDSVSGLELECLSSEALKAHISTQQQSDFFRF